MRDFSQITILIMRKESLSVCVKNRSTLLDLSIALQFILAAYSAF
ncbi:hypothetical protein DN39_2761 [Vibrio cholerae]|nr:hypothetical protein DN32_3269 [Vibrio cholerae]KFE00740.1 hypothetical protein DN43_2931 [Vibrio cholerae]KFE18880.1 hypothetical protein DN39_2761 [Vibrio cholerae]